MPRIVLLNSAEVWMNMPQDITFELAGWEYPSTLARRLNGNKKFERMDEPGDVGPWPIRYAHAASAKLDSSMTIRVNMRGEGNWVGLVSADMDLATDTPIPHENLVGEKDLWVMNSDSGVAWHGAQCSRSMYDDEGHYTKRPISIIYNKDAGTVTWEYDGETLNQFTDVTGDVKLVVLLYGMGGSATIEDGTAAADAGAQQLSLYDRRMGPTPRLHGRSWDFKY